MSISGVGASNIGIYSNGSVDRTNYPQNSASTRTAATKASNDQSFLSRLGTDGTGINREIRVNGNLIGVVFNSGVLALDNEYKEIGDLLGWNSSASLEDEKGLYGPALADLRTAKLMAVLEDASSGQINKTEAAFLSTLKGAKFEISIAPTAMTQAEFDSWMTTRDTSTGRHLDFSV